MPGQFQHVLSLCGTCTQTTLPTLQWPACTPHLHLYWIGVQSHIFFKMWNTRDNSFASPLNIACYNCLDQCLWSPFVSTWKANKISKPLVLATTHLFSFFFFLSYIVHMCMFPWILSGHLRSTLIFSGMKRLCPYSDMRSQIIWDDWRVIRRPFIHWVGAPLAGFQDLVIIWEWEILVICILL